MLRAVETDNYVERAPDYGGSVFRPIQYLGSKLRSIDHVVANLADCISPHATVFDVFTGTSVVSQALADAGMRVVATDAMSFCTIFAESLLSVGRDSAKLQSAEALNELILEHAEEISASTVFEDLIADERFAIVNSDSQTLFDLSEAVPQAWRTTNGLVGPSIVSSANNSKKIVSGAQNGIMSSYYAGTYFGLHQAVMIDRLRIAIEAAWISRLISRWEYSSALTALLHACSVAVFSPGKHFAQYHRIDHKKNLDFHRKRILTDRAVSIEDRFESALQKIWSRSNRTRSKHLARQATMEDVVTDPSWLPKVDLIYADPPYTAQQYSRFYHIPESLILYNEPIMQEFRGGLTAGLYPADRFKSRFSSKRNAPDAFIDLSNLGRTLGANLAISYSESSSGKTGNDRMIMRDDLVAICRQNYRNVETLKLSHAYRQFNESAAAVEDRADHEYLLVCSN